jgi:hypothetical protein
MTEFELIEIEHRFRHMEEAIEQAYRKQRRWISNEHEMDVREIFTGLEAWARGCRRDLVAMQEALRK